MRDHQNKRTSMNRPTVINILLRIESTAKKYIRNRKNEILYLYRCTYTKKNVQLTYIIYILYYDIMISIFIFHPRRNEFVHFKNSE